MLAGGIGTLKTIHMKQVLSLLMVLLLLQGHAQDSALYKPRIFKLKVYTVTGQTLSGYLNKVTDSSLSLSDKAIFFHPYTPLSTDARNIGFYNIQKIQVRRKNAALRGLWQGALIGFAVGAITGLIDGDDEGLNDGSWCILCFTAAEKAMILGGLGTVAGGLTGTLIGGLLRKQFVIGGQKPKFDHMRLSMLERIGLKPAK